MSKVKLSEIGTFKNGLNFSAERVLSGCKMIGVPDFGDNYLAKLDGLKEVDEDIVSTDYLLQDNDILFVRSNGNKNLVGRAMLIEKIKEKVTFSGFCIRFRITNNNVNPLYMLYLFKSPLFRKLFSNTQQTSISNLNQEILGNIEVELPTIGQQNRIVKVIHGITRKIENNKRINDNLEQQVRLLYDYWFTQFDFPDENGEPYRSSGGKMVWNEQLKRTIPDGWTTNPLSDIFTFKSGYSFSSDLYEMSGKYKLLTIKNVQNNGINLNVDNYINVLPDNLPDYCLLKAKDILMSLTGNVGRVGIMYADNCLLNQRVALAEPVNINQRVFVYFLLKSDIIHKQYEMIANGSSQQNLSQIEAEKVIIAYNPEVATKFSTLCNEYLNTIVSNLAENQELINIRDWLLPMLMNGQATISD